MSQHEEIDLDGEKYFVSLYSASKGNKLLIRLTKILGKPMATLGLSGGLEADLSADLVISLFDSANDLLNPDEMDKLIKEILEGVLKIDQSTMKNRPINFDLDFKGKYLHLYKLLAQIIQFQFQDFLSELIDRAKGFLPSEQKIPNRTVKVKAKAS